MKTYVLSKFRPAEIVDLEKNATKVNILSK